MFRFRDGYYADIRMEDSYKTVVRYVNEKLEEALERKEKRAFIRVFNGSYWYYASVTDVNLIQKQLDEIYDMLPPGENICDHPIVRKYEVNKDKIYLYEKNNVADVPLMDKLELCQSYFESMRWSEYGVMSSVLYADRHSNYRFYSSKGADIEYDMQLAGMAFMRALKKDEEKITMQHSFTECDFSLLKGRQKEVVEKIAEYEDALLNSVPCEQGVFPVVLAPMVTGIFAHESFGHKSEADFMIGDETMKKEWELGKKVGSDILSITDSGIDIGSGYVPYDDEGTKATKTYLIKNGVLTGRLHSATTAAELGEELTGNARAVSCEFEPIVRMTTTVVEGGENTFEELIGRIKKGYYIKVPSHGSGMSTFTIAPDLAYEVTDGKIGRPVKISVISGNVFETLGLIEGATKEVKVQVNVFGGCGKMEQFPLPVGYGGPYLYISKMNVM